jgi:hypothetical protein
MSELMQVLTVIGTTAILFTVFFAVVVRQMNRPL